MAVTIGTLISPARRAMVASGLLTAAGAVLGVVPYAALHNMAAIWLGESERGGWAASPWAWAAVAVVSLLAAQVLYLMGLGVTHLAEARLRHLLRTQVVDALGHLPLGRVAAIPHGAIRKMVADDTSSIHTLVAHVPGDVTNAAVGTVAGMAYLLWADWRLALALLGVWCLVLVAAAVPVVRGFGDITDRFGVAQTRLAAATVEMLEGVKEIKSFQAADATRTRFNAAREHFSDISYEWVSASGRTISLMGAFLRPATVFATVAPLAVLFVARGWTQPSATLPFFLLALGLPEGLQTLVGMMQQMYESRMAAQTTAELLSQAPMPEGARNEGEGPAPGRVEADGVTFSYEAGSPVLRGVSFTAEPGTVTALVGPSGGGKSTLARLIARFYDVDDGAVRVAGIDVREATFPWLLSRVAIVLQDVDLSHDSVADNIALGRPGATREQIEAAARAACIHERIMRLPRGYDTVLGEEGGFLSGGERQRVTLARAYLQDAPVLVLDEATAQADPASERDIHLALSRLTAGRTVIVIAHRLSTVRDADQILVVDDGRIVERGRHDELVVADGRYASMWRSQDLDPGGPGGSDDDDGDDDPEGRDRAGAAAATAGEGE
ncbi:ABC transporter ATP-binding protein [Actinomyces israelii]|uniref:ABC transporter ATP-binding protein n=1 Tax=Actinomyces israelii TaxID=1659 RepID=A0ABT4I991_9ACTO|nr:ABC transporter ATP-binding protein [Actinomyces israelii]MCZ0857929.1 ABC transporter ATP-binding protein [Actinomyces israelii]WKR22249.1 Vitamin B12 import ATP-binding protein BtuD [Actinomyces israelii]